MKAETKGFLKLVAVGLPAIVVIITILTFILSIAGMVLAIERGWLD